MSAARRTTDERDPLPEEPWEPTSSEYRRREALQACKEAVARFRESGKRPAGEVAAQ